jgi:nucleotide-binding universal stress UspA family protein
MVIHLVGLAVGGALYESAWELGLAILIIIGPLQWVAVIIANDAPRRRLHARAGSGVCRTNSNHTTATDPTRYTDMITSGHDTACPAPDGTHRAAAVVVGVDDSPQAQAALAWAAKHAQRSDARVLAVAAWSPPVQVVPGPGPGAAALVTSALTDEQMQAQAHRRLSSALTDLPTGAAQLVDRSVVRGDAATALLDAAHDAELLVLGNAGRGALASAVVGSVAARCVHHAGCPIVLVPDPARSDQASADAQ